MVELHLCIKLDKPSQRCFLKLPALSTVRELRALIEEATAVSLQGHRLVHVAYLTDARDIPEPEAETRRAAEEEDEEQDQQQRKSSRDLEQAVGTAKSGQATERTQQTLEALGITTRSTVLVFAPRQTELVAPPHTDSEQDQDPYEGLSIKNVCSKLRTAPGGKQRKRVMEYIQIYTEEVVQSPGWLQLEEKQIFSVLRSSRLNITESDLFTALLKWADAAHGSGKSPSKQKALAKLLPLIRFPLMRTDEVATLVAPAGVLEEVQILALFTYLGSADPGKRGPLPDCLKHFNATPRESRKAPAWFKWSEDLKQVSLELKDEGQVVCSNNTNHKTVLGDRELSTGKHIWKLRVDAMSNNAIIVGVAESKTSIDWNTNAMLAQHGQIRGWGYNIQQRWKRSTTDSSKTKAGYGSAKAQVGSVIRVVLDLDEGTLEYGLDDKSQGVAFTDVSGPVRPALTISGNAQVTLLF